MQTTAQPSIVRPLSVSTPSRVNWPHVAWFLGLAFGLSWLADLALYLNGVLVMERAPSDQTWIDLCGAHNILLVWPEIFPSKIKV